MKIRSFHFLCLPLLLILGCHDNGEEQVIIVNGTPICAKDIEETADMRLRLIMARQPFADSAKFERARTNVVAATYGALVFQNLRDSFILTNQADIVAGEWDAVTSRYVRAFCRPGEGFKSLEALFETAGELKRFRDAVAAEARARSYYLTHYRDDYVVTDERVRKAMETMARENQEAEATNRIVWATASNLVSRARGGEDFALLADRYSQEAGRNPGGLLGECDASDFADEGEMLWRILSGLPKGGVSDILETGDGICIYKCLDVVRKSENTGKPARVLARICLHRALLYPESEFEEVKEELENGRREKVERAVMKNLIAEANLEFPCGLERIPERARRSLLPLLPPDMRQRLMREMKRESINGMKSIFRNRMKEKK